MPDIGASSLSIAFGDFRRGYLVVDRAGVRILRDPYSAKPFVLFYTTKRVGGGVLSDLAALRVQLAFIKLDLVLRRKYRPDQPRVPAGNPDGGQWTSEGGGAGSTAVSRARRIAEVIQICVTSGKSLLTNEFGVKTFSVTYECPGGRELKLEGFGHNPPGFVRDPYQAAG